MLQHSAAMSLDHALDTAELLTRQQEVDIARSIEAGLYAQHLLDQDPSRCDAADLRRVAAAGQRAEQRMWHANLRLVAKLASWSVARSGLAYDDLFQEGCLGLAEAIRRFDHARGNKFSTLAHTYVSRRISASITFRNGATDNHLIAARHRARLKKSYEEHIRHHDPSWKEVARSAGLSLQVAARATLRHVTLDETHPVLACEDEQLRSVEVLEMDFLDILAADGELLRRRFGIGRTAQTQSELADHYGVSTSSIARMVDRALQRARALLDSDLCRWAS